MGGTEIGCRNTHQDFGTKMGENSKVEEKIRVESGPENWPYDAQLGVVTFPSHSTVL